MWIHGIVLATAVIVGVVIRHSQNNNNKGILQFRGGRRHPNPPTPSAVISTSELQDYRRDGFLLKKGLIANVDRLVQAGKEIYHTQHKMDAQVPSYYQKLTFDVWRRSNEFAQLAFEDLPSVAAELLEIGKTDNKDVEPQDTIRILKDGFFGFQQKNNSGCGFHVDDMGFWPASYETTGVNFWIALSPTRIVEGGGIRVVNQSQVEPIFEECRNVITAIGPQGYPKTCAMEDLSPECHEKMLEASVVFDMEPGDALIWDRWTFHRSEPFRTVIQTDDDEKTTTSSSSAQEKDYRLRYTIRYVPGTAKAWGRHHPSQAAGEMYDSPYYPRVWPSASKSEIKAIQQGLED